MKPGSPECKLQMQSREPHLKAWQEMIRGTGTRCSITSIRLAEGRASRAARRLETVMAPDTSRTVSCAQRPSLASTYGGMCGLCFKQTCLVYAYVVLVSRSAGSCARSIFHPGRLIHPARPNVRAPVRGGGELPGAVRYELWSVSIYSKRP